MTAKFEPAPELEVSEWINAAEPLSLAALRGRVVVVHAFQMLCPGCVMHGTPQAVKIHQAFDRDDVVVLGLHTVFEHHSVMGPEALKVFMREYRIPFPVGVDRAVAGSPIPATMQRYALRGTPSLLVVGRNGTLRLNHFGSLDDMPLGALLGQLAAEPE
jgi:thiol-disulfide isomerase/thioredoxin